MPHPVVDVPVISVKGLSYEYPGKLTLDAIDFQVARGSITSVIGPNGAGKTTLLMCMATLARPMSGEIMVEGLDMFNDLLACRSKVGLVADFFGLYDKLTVNDFLEYFAYARNISATDVSDRVSETAESLGLSGRLSDSVGTLSRGMRQRLGIAQAIIHEPSLLLLDEPASGLDPQARNDLSGLLKDLNARGTTIVVSSHILNELQDYSTDVMILKEGRLISHKPFARYGDTDNIGVRLTIRCQTADPQLSGVLEAFEGADNVEVSKNTWTFSLSGGTDRQGELLRLLVERGIPVLEFKESMASMQDEYLRFIAEEQQ